MLNYISNICEKNNIKYSLIGGSLIGSIRHKGIIPWDDDIDIILMPEEYKKLLKILIKNKSEYKILIPGKNNSYPYPFCKIYNPKTVLIEKRQKEFGEYGIYLDIFAYHYISNNKLIQFFHYKMLTFLKILLSASMLKKEELNNETNCLKRIRNRISCLIGQEKLIKYYINLCDKKKKKTKYVLSNWPTYGLKKEIQKSNNFDNYKNVKFENIDAMITENYDKVLKTTFGDYMKLPPKEKRVSNHNSIAYWRDDNEKIKK